MIHRSLTTGFCPRGGGGAGIGIILFGTHGCVHVFFKDQVFKDQGPCRSLASTTACGSKHTPRLGGNTCTNRWSIAMLCGPGRVQIQPSTVGGNPPIIPISTRSLPWGHWGWLRESYDTTTTTTTSSKLAGWGPPDFASLPTRQHVTLRRSGRSTQCQEAS